VARLAALHPNTVREHLDRLIRAGLVVRARARPAGRGRPAWLYEATPVTSGASDYVDLATALSAAMLRVSPDPRHDAELAGEDWGRDLARRRQAAPTTPEEARDHVVAILDDLGFAPRQDDPLDPSRVRLTRCPLLDAARRNPRIVCNVHLGMLRGALTEYGGDPTESALVPFSEPGACLLVIPPVPAPRD
jgi:predicted ArsR family transcriptional regulator